MYKMASFFTGMGGIDEGFRGTNQVETIYADEIDKYPAETFELNFSIKIDCRDIREVNESEIPDVDIICGGFPCQPFSTAGKREGIEDKKGRGTMFFEILRIIKAKKPRVIFLENVKGLLSNNKGDTFKLFLELLNEAGYHVKYKLMNASEYGNIPQNRERVYFVGFLNEKDFDNFRFPEPISLTTKLSDIIDFENKIDDKYYYTEGKYKGEMFSIIKKEMTEMNTVYLRKRRAHEVKKNKNDLIPTLTAAMGTGGHNVPLIKTQFGIRKLTPQECLNSMSYPADFKLPKQSDSRLYKQIGNSVCVSVVQRIAENIVRALNKTDEEE